MYLNTGYGNNMPPQQVSYKIKFVDDKDSSGHTKWMKDCMDSLESYGRYFIFQNIPLSKNYDILSGRFNIEDYTDTFDTYDFSTAISEEMKLGGFLKHYDITTKAVRLLTGEFIKRPDIHRVVAVDPSTTNEKLRIKEDLVHVYMQQSISQEIEKKMLSKGIDPNKSDFKSEQEASEYKSEIEQLYKELTPQSIEKYMTYDYRSAGEHWGQAVLIDSKERFRLKEQDTMEYQDMCTVSRAFSHIFLTPKGFKIETWNPLNTFYDLSPHIDYLDEGQRIGRQLFMTKAQILDTFGWMMDINQLEALYPEYNNYKKAKGAGNGVYDEFFHAQMYPFNDYRQFKELGEAFAIPELTNVDNPVGLNSINHNVVGYGFARQDMVLVTQAYWKSQKKVGKLNLQNPETGEIQTTLVDESFDPKLFNIKVSNESYKYSEEPNTISWTWITEVWQGIKLAVNYKVDDTTEDRNGIYIDIRPCEFQRRGNDPRLMWDSKLPVIGKIFNNRNGRAMSVVDLLKPYQILVNAFCNQAYHVAQKGNGKFVFLGSSILNSEKDWGGDEALERSMSIANNLGIVVYNDADPNSRASAQYVKEIDLDESERVTRLINLASLVENQGFLQLGITPQRQGSVQASETATGTSTAVNNSYAVTEIYFEDFANYRRRKLEAILEMAQWIAINKEDNLNVPYIQSDLGQAFIQVTKDDLLLRDLSIYVVNSAELQAKKQLMEQLVLKNNQNLLPLSTLLDIIALDNPTDIKKIVEVKEREAQQSQQQAEQAQQNHEKELEQMAQAEKEAEREFKATQNQLDRENELRKVVLQGIANESSYNPDADLTDKLINQAKLNLDQSKMAAESMFAHKELLNNQLSDLRKHKLEKDKLKTQEKIADKQASLKKEEMKNKLEIENKKIQQIDIQNKNQEKLQQNKAKIDKELADKKIELEKTKIRLKPKPKK